MSAPDEVLSKNTSMPRWPYMPKRKASAEIEPQWAGFPERLKKVFGLRKLQRGWSQRKVAEKARYDAPNFSRLLRKKPLGWEGITANAALAFARALEVSPMWLLTGDGAAPEGIDEGSAAESARRHPVVENDRFEGQTQKLFDSTRPDVPDRTGE